MYYKLNEDFTTQVTDDASEAWASKEDYPLGLKDVVNGKLVSTVFLPIDHNYHDTGSPLIFETMVFETESIGTEIYMDRYTDYGDSVKGHEYAKQWVMDGCKDDRG